MVSVWVRTLLLVLICSIFNIFAGCSQTPADTYNGKHDTDSSTTAGTDACGGDLGGDSDGDGLCDSEDPCPLNDDLRCKPSPCFDLGLPDADWDGVCDADDICPGKDDLANADQDAIIDCLDPCVDADQDTVCDPFDQCPDGDDRLDADGDLLPDCVDPCNDADGDFVCDGDDACPGYNDSLDLNGDSVPDYCETGPCSDTADIDGDGTVDCDDGCPWDFTKQAPGVCGCGVYDNDSDGDGVHDCNDGCPEDATKTAPDICGCGHSDALDRDGDSVPDCIDPCPVHKPDDPDGDGFCGAVTDYCPDGDDLDGDHVCDPDDLCLGDDASGDADQDGYCNNLDACFGDDKTGDFDHDRVCADEDICDGNDWTGDADGDGTCNDSDPACAANPENDQDGDGICDASDFCQFSAAGDLDNDGECDPHERCPLDPYNDEDHDGICSRDDLCPLDPLDDVDMDGLCGNLDLCTGDNSFGDSDGDGVCEDNDLCEGNDLYGDLDSDGICDTFSCPADTPAFYTDQTLGAIERAAGGACAEFYGIDGAPACSDSDWASFKADIDYMLANYEFVNAIFDQGSGGGQTYAKNPFSLLCVGFDGSPTIVSAFDDLNSCFHGASNWGTDYNLAIIEFDWGVNVWRNIDYYAARAADYGAECEFDNLTGSPTGFHATLDTLRYWEVLSTAQCDYYGCRCQATLKGWIDGDGTFFFQQIDQNSILVEPFQGAKCDDPRFNF